MSNISQADKGKQTYSAGALLKRFFPYIKKYGHLMAFDEFSLGNGGAAYGYGHHQDGDTVRCPQTH